MAAAEQYLSEVLGAFDFGAPVVGAIRFGAGHINDTFVVHTQPDDCCCRRFILQRMSPAAFKRPDQLMENIIGVTDYLGQEIEKHGGDRSREALEVLRPKNGQPYYTDQGDGTWRVYPFVENTICYQTAESPALFAASGRAFGRFQRLLRDYPPKTLYETIPNFQHRGPSCQAQGRRGRRRPGPGQGLSGGNSVHAGPGGRLLGGPPGPAGWGTPPAGDPQ